MSNTTTMQTLDSAANDFLNLFNGAPTEIELFKAGAEWQAKQQLPEIAQKEPVNFLLANALKLCTEDQLIALRDLLIERTPKQQVAIDEVEIEKLAEEYAHTHSFGETDKWIQHSHFMLKECYKAALQNK